MAVMASWNGKTWGVSSQRIAALNGVSSSVELDTENSDDKAGSPATSQVLRCAGVALLAEGVDRNYLAGRRFGPANLQLTGVSLSDTTLDNFGRILKGKITINLTEYAEEASSKKAGAGGSSKSSSAVGVSSSGGVGRRLSAVTVGASSSDKAAKKPNNAQLK